MKKLKLTRLIAIGLMTFSILVLNPIGANAVWEKSSSGNTWRFTDKSVMTSNAWLYDRDNGKTYFINVLGEMVTGWIIIDDKWYYFYQNGSLAKNTTINGYTVGSDGSCTNGVANGFGAYSIYKYTISNGVVVSNTITENNVKEKPVETVSSKSVKTASDLETYLDNKYSKLETPIGTLTLSFDVDENDDDYLGYDFSIETKYDDIIKDSKYNIDFFDSNDLEHSTKISSSDKEKTKQLLKQRQKDIGEDAIKLFPNKKIEGCYYDSWYDYQYTKVGYNSESFYSWKNYDVIDKDKIGDEYDNTKITGFRWDEENDDVALD